MSRIGFGVALPVLDPDDVIDSIAVMMAFATRGYMDMWLYLPERLGVDAAVAAMIPTGDNDGQEAELGVQAAVCSASLSAMPRSAFVCRSARSPRPTATTKRRPA